MRPGMIDWIDSVESFFKKKTKRLIITELGKGYGTIWLAQNFKSVTSIEYTRYPYTDSWEKYGLKNHRLINIEPIDNLAKLDNILIDSLGKQRSEELNLEAWRLYNEAVKYPADVLLIDHGCHNRGEVLDYAINGNDFKYLIVHDTNFPYYAYKLDKERGKYSICYSTNQGQGVVIYSMV